MIWADNASNLDIESSRPRYGDIWRRQECCQVNWLPIFIIGILRVQDVALLCSVSTEPNRACDPKRWQGPVLQPEPRQRIGAAGSPEIDPTASATSAAVRFMTISKWPAASRVRGSKSRLKAAPAQVLRVRSPGPSRRIHEVGRKGSRNFGGCGGLMWDYESEGSGCKWRSLPRLSRSGDIPTSLILMILVPAFPSRVNAISIPSERKGVCARRRRPASARGFLGHPVPAHTSGRRFRLIVHHTDAEREYAYDRKSEFGRLDKALDLAPLPLDRDMKSDWKRVFPFP